MIILFKLQESFSSVSVTSGNGTNHVPAGVMKLSEKNYAIGSHNVVDVDDFGSDMLYGENEHMDMFYDDELFDDPYSKLQSHFDHLDIPPGVEVPIPWLTAEEGNTMMFDMPSTSTHPTSDIQLDPPGYSPWIDSSPSWTSEPEQKNQTSASGGSDQLQDIQKLKASSKWSSADRSEARKKLLASRSSTKLQCKLSKDALHFPSFPPTMESIKAFHHGSHSKRKPQDWQNMAESSLQKQNPAVANAFPKLVKHVGSGGLYDVGLHTGTPAAVKNVMLAKHTYGGSSVGSPFPSGFFDPSGPMPVFSEEMPFGSWSHIETQKVSSFAGNSSNSSEPITIEYGSPDEVLKKFDLFKRFDTVQDYSDHYYSRNGSSVKQV